MITTLTPNPSIDRTVSVGELVVGEVLRTGTGIAEAGGKGVNVARALQLEGVQSSAIVPCTPGDPFGALLEHAEVNATLVETPGPVRTNISVIEADGRTTKLNEPGPHLSPEAVEAILGAVETAARTSQWFVAAGSLAPGMGSDFYSRLARRISGCGANLAVDASGPALAQVMGSASITLKPNLEELAEVWPTPIQTAYDGIGAAVELVEGGAAAVLLSLGADGAVLATHEGVFRGAAPCDRVVNTVGAGDSLLAGYLAAESRPNATPATSLAEALAWGRAAVRNQGTGFASVDDEDRAAVAVEELTP